MFFGNEFFTETCGDAAKSFQILIGNIFDQFLGHPDKKVIDFLSLNLDDDDLLNLGSILYVLIYNNAKYRKDLEQIVNVFLQKAQYSDRPERDVVFKVALSMVAAPWGSRRC